MANMLLPEPDNPVNQVISLFVSIKLRGLSAVTFFQKSDKYFLPYKLSY